MTPSHKVRDYIFEEKIGEGGMGAVYRARHSMLDRPVAIKILSDQLLTSAEFGERFLREARAQAKLHHPNIVQVSDFFQEGGKYYLVMALIEGESLEQRLAKNRILTLNEASRISADVLAALDYAHQRGVIHRDVKTSNILIDKEGRAYLADFGIMLMVGAERKTRTGSTIGTAFYMSPEQIRRPRALDHRTDVYSFGCVLYEMLTGHTPFEKGDEEGDTDFVVKDGHVNRMPDPPRLKNPQLPASIDGIVLKALAKDPNERYSGCGEFAHAIAQLSSGPQPQPRPQHHSFPPQPQPQHHSFPPQPQPFPPTPQPWPQPQPQPFPPQPQPRPEPFPRQALLIPERERAVFLWSFVAASAVARTLGVIITTVILNNSVRRFDFTSMSVLTQIFVGALEGFVTGALVAAAQFFLLKSRTQAARNWAIATVAGYAASFVFAELVAYRAFGLVKTSAFVFIYGWVIVAFAQWLAVRQYVRGAWQLIVAVFAASTLWYLVAIALGPSPSWAMAIVRSIVIGLLLGFAQAFCFIRFERVE